MDRTTAAVWVLAVSLVPATIGAQADRGDLTARFAEFRMLRAMVLEAPGSSLGATVRGSRDGATVEQVMPASPAARAGLQSGDVVIELDRVTVTDARQFERLVRHTPRGRLTIAVVVRDGERRWLALTL